jgi:hypothetical protein
MTASRTAIGVAALLLTATSVVAQETRLATTAEALIASARFFHGRSVVVRQPVAQEGAYARLANTTKPVFVFWRGRQATTGEEVRGDFWDVGRIEQGDSRFTQYDIAGLLLAVNDGRWPARDQIYVLVGASAMPASPSTRPTIRAIALAPDSFVDREVRVIGRFRGRNLFGELPNALGRGKWDFVLRSADGAMWVTGVRPRGNGFDLDPGRRVDTGKWIEVTGVVKQDAFGPYLEGSSVALSSEQVEPTVEVELPAQPVMPPPEVIFSAPVADDVDVERSAPVRVQFSRDMDSRSIRDRIRVTYINPPAGQPLPPVPDFSVKYNDANHSIEISFKQPLERFQQVKVEFLEGMAALDKQPLKPWSLTFTTGR